MHKNNILFFLPGIALLLLFSVLADFNGLYGADGYEYLAYSKKLKEFILTGTNPGVFHWPPLYPLLGALFSFLLEPVFSLQLVSILSFAGALVYAARILKHVYGNERGINLYVLLFGALSPYFLRLSLCVMSDMTAILFCTAAIFHALKHKASASTRDLLLLLLFATLAVLTRYSAFLVLFIPLTAAGIVWMRKTKPLVLILCCSLLAALAFAAGFVYPEYIQDAYHHSLFQRWSVWHYFLSEFNYEDGPQLYKQPNLVFILFLFVHPGFIFLSPLLLFFVGSIKQNRDLLLWILTPLFVYILFLGGLPNQNIRLLSFVFPLALILFFMPWRMFFRKYISDVRRKTFFYSVTLIIQAVLFFFAFQGIYKLNKSDRSRALLVKALSGNKTLYTFGTENSLRAYGATNKIIPLWEKEIGSTEKGTFVLVNDIEVGKQQGNALLMQNWERIRRQADLNNPVFRSGEWVLYEME